jgi:hypothetical protein
VGEDLLLQHVEGRRARPCDPQRGTSPTYLKCDTIRRCLRNRDAALLQQTILSCNLSRSRCALGSDLLLAKSGDGGGRIEIPVIAPAP